MLTRRCAGRHRWLTPGSKLNNLFWYLFAVGAQQFGLQVHALVVMSTHYHAIVTDPRGRIPAFEQWLHSLLARAVNQLRERTDTFWGGRQGGRQVIADALALRDALVYVWNNPTKAGLVRRGKHWPGVRTTPHQMLANMGTHEVKVIERPKGFFDQAGGMPETAELALSMPAMLLEQHELWLPTGDEGADEGGGEGACEDDAKAQVRAGATQPGPEDGAGTDRDAEPSAGREGHDEPGAEPDAATKKLASRIVAKLKELVRQAEDKAAEALWEAGRHFVGAQSVKRQSPNVTSKTPEKHGAKCVRVPIFLTSSKEMRAELLAKLHDWRARYDAARKTLGVYLGKKASGEAPDLGLVEDREEPKPEEPKPPVFPWGTYLLRLKLGVPCHPPPS